MAHTPMLLSSILDKFCSSDKDFRYMATSDLLGELSKPEFKINDPTTEQKVCRLVVQQLEDASGDISALAVKCLACLVVKVPERLLEQILKDLCGKLTKPRKKNSSNSDAAGIGLKAAISELPNTAGDLVAPTCIPPLMEGLTNQTNVDIRQDCIEAIHTVISRFGSSLKEQWPLTELLLLELEDSRSGLQKKASTCIPGLAVHMTDALLGKLMDAILGKLNTQLPERLAQVYMQTLGGISKAVGYRFGAFLPKAVPIAMSHCRSATEEAAEMQESALQALENVICFCSLDVQKYMDEIIDLSLAQLSYDPNFDDGSMDEGDDEDDEDDDRDLTEDDYSDDEDMTWKVRRAAANCLSASFQAYPDKIVGMYQRCCARLVSRFKEREENVKLEIFRTFSTLIDQLSTTARSSHSKVDVAAILAPDQALFLGQLCKQLRSRNVSTKCGIFQVLKVIVQANPACVQEHIDILMPPLQAALIDKSGNSALKIEALSFSMLVMIPANRDVVVPRLPELVEGLVHSLNDRYYKVSAEALNVCQCMALMIKPEVDAPMDTSTQNIVKMIFEAVLERLKASDQDQEVKDNAIRCMATMVSCLSTVLAPQAKTVLAVLFERLKNQVTRLTAVKAFGAVAQASEPVPLDEVLSPLVVEMTTFLRKKQRSLRHASLTTLTAIITRYGNQLDQSSLEGLLADAGPLVSDTDLLLAAATLDMSSAIFRSNGHMGATPATMELVGQAVKFGSSPLLQGAAHVALKHFFCALAATNTPTIQSNDLQDILLNAGTSLARTPQRSLAECVAALCSAAGEVSTKATLTRCIQTVQAAHHEGQQRIMLLLIGEVGRIADLSSVPEVESVVINALGASNEEVKAAASLALGGVATGNLEKYLPFLLGQIAEAQRGTPKQMYLLLKALNEVLRTASSKRIPLTQEQATQIIGLLMKSMEIEEECRNMVSDCLAQLAFLDPQAVMPILHSKLTDPSPSMRCSMVAAVCHMLYDGPHSVDACLSTYLADFLKMMQDENHNVRKESVQLLTALAHTKPLLVTPLLQEAVPLLYEQTVINRDLVRVVDLGPFKQTIDDGLGLRKATYECMEGLLHRYRDRMDPVDLVSQLESGLGDDKDIKLVCHTMLAQLARSAPNAVLATLSLLLPPLQKTLGTRIKTDAVKQERDRYEELLKNCLTAVYAVVVLIPQASSIVPGFKTFVDRHIVAQPEMNARWKAVKAQNLEAEKA